MSTLSFEDATGGGGADGDSSNVQLLRDIEQISNALYRHQTPQRPLISLPNHKSEPNQESRLPASKSKLSLDFTDSGVEGLGRQKRSSIWQWKPLKALSHVRQKKYDCCFFCHVHCIDNLPIEFNDLQMAVYWKRKDNVINTLPSRVCNGTAKFDETMMDRCLIYCSRNGSGSFVKYEPKHYLLYPSLFGDPGGDIGKHWIDLTRFLPLTIDELMELKSPGKWATSFSLGGKAEGATLHVSFGFFATDNTSKLNGDGARSDLIHRFKQDRMRLLNNSESSVSGGNNGMLRRVGSASACLSFESSNSSSDSDIKILHQVWPNPGSEFSDSVEYLYKKIDDENQTGSEKIDVPSTKREPFKAMTDSYFSYRNNIRDEECIGTEFTVTEKGTEVDLPEGDQLKLEQPVAENIDDSDIEVVNVSYIFEDREGLPAEAVTLNLEIRGSNGFENDNPYDTCNISCKDEEGPSVKTIKLDLETRDLSGFKNDGTYDTSTSSCMDEEGLPVEVIKLDLDTRGFDGSENDGALGTCTDTGNVDLNTEDLDIELYNMLLTECIDTENRFLEPIEAIKTNRRPSKVVKSLSLDAITEAVADDFLKLLGEKTSPSSSTPSSCQESPRERLLREFEQDIFDYGKFLFSSDANEETERSWLTSSLSCSEIVLTDILCPPPIRTSKIDFPGNELKKERRKANSLECLETQSLMDSWGLDEEALGKSYDYNTGGFGSPIYVAPKEVGLPPLGEGLGSFLKLKHGGILRSMNRSLFHDPDSGAVLIIQASRPIVLPAKMGSDIMEVIQFLASMGHASLCKKVSDLMPLEQISGKVMQQLSQEACSIKMESDRMNYSVEDKEYGAYASLEKDTVISTSIGEDSESMSASMQNLPFLLMDQVEGLLIEGLRIQSGLSEVAPSTIDCQKTSSRAGDIVGQPSTDPSSCGNAKQALMDISLSLDEWLRLDSTTFSIEDQTSGHLARLLTAHDDAHLSHFDVEDFEGDIRRENGSLKCGLLGDNPIVAIMIQLRDPVRNYEPVGAPMLSLIEVNRKVDHQKPAASSEKSAERTTNVAEEIGESSITKFAVRQAHLTGLSMGSDDPDIWATKRQRLAGYRWLLSNNMSKTDKDNLSKSTAVIRYHPSTRKQPPATILWSISHEYVQLDAQWGESPTQDTCIRNPDMMMLW